MPKKKWDLVNEAQQWFAHAQREYEYRLGMHTLYSMCWDVPDHEDVKQTISKLWLIGRSHAAALERRRESKRFPEPYEPTAERLSKDAVFKKLLRDARQPRTKPEKYDERHLAAIHAVVSRLAMVFEETTGLSKVSLASKYAHFHAPDVPIYDSISSSALRLLLQKRDIPHDAAVYWDRDIYGRHLARFTAAFRILKSSGFDVDARSLDTFLLSWGDD